MTELSPALAATLAFAGGYLLGAIPFGLLLTRAAGLGDIRQTGSGNIGATNVLRTGNRLVAAATLAADMLKGTLPVLAAAAAFGDTAAVAAAFGALFGHILPVWLRFKGGKGVATYIGVQIGLLWPVALAFIGVWIIVAAVFRYSSLSALVAALTAPVSALIFGNATIALVFGAMSVFMIFTHRANISRLYNHKESKISLRS